MAKSPDNAGNSDKGSPSVFALFTAQPYLLLTLAPLFWGGNITAGKLAVGQIAPDMLVLGRWTGALLILATFAWRHVKADWPQIRKGFRFLMFYGIVGFAGFNMAMYAAAPFTSAVNASIEQAAIAPFVLIGNLLVFGVRPKFLQIIGLLITILGVVWVATHGDPTRLVELDVGIGDALVLLACLFYAIYSLLLRFRPNVDWISFIFVTASSAWAAAFFFVAAGPGGLATLPDKLAAITPLGWLCLLYVMVFPSILAQLCYAQGVSLVGPNRASIFINLLPVFGTIISVLVLGEAIEFFHLVAGAMVIAGIAIAEYAVRRRP